MPKRCKRCKSYKQDYEFGENMRMPDGLSVLCLSCKEENMLKKRGHIVMSGAHVREGIIEDALDGLLKVFHDFYRKKQNELC